MATLQTLKQFWYNVKPQGITMEVYNQRVHASGHSMLFFLLIALRNKQTSQPNKIKIAFPKQPDKKEEIAGAFNMNDVEALAALMPDEILQPYRKNRSYINSVLAFNEISRKENAGCKMTFIRVERGWYIVNPNIKWEKMI